MEVHVTFHIYSKVKKRSSERLSDLPKATQLGREEVWIHTISKKPTNSREVGDGSALRFRRTQE
jgi:hypothetical protein